MLKDTIQSMSPTFSKAQFAKNIQYFRGDKSLRETAKVIGVTHTTLFRAEKMEAIELDSILKICDWMDASIEVFIHRTFKTDI